MKLLVIGRSGQVARSLEMEAKHAGVDLKTLGRPNIDLTQADTLARAIDNFAPTHVINAAAYTAVDAAETEQDAARVINAEGPRYLARACDAAGIPLLHLSTDYVFDGRQKTPYSEDDAVSPLGVYGQTKLDGEKGVRDATDKHVILRTAWVYSPFGKNFVKTMLRLAQDRDEVSVVNDQIGTPSYAPHIANALLSICRTLDSEREPFGTYHLAGTGDGSWADVAETTFAASAALGGPSAKVNRITTAEYPTPAQRPANSRLNTEKLYNAFGVRLPEWQTGVQDCVRRLLQTTDNV